MTRNYERSPLVPPRQMEEHVVRNEFSVAKGDDLIGHMRSLRLEKGDTLPDIARHFSLGLNGVSAANPGVDVWVPEAGKRITLPMSFILPDAPRERHRDQPGRNETVSVQRKQRSRWQW